jgi:HlyD family secretion protein
MTTKASDADLADIINKARAQSPLRLWLVIIVLAAAAGGGAWWWFSRKAASGKAPVFATEPLRKGDIPLTITATGNLEPTNHDWQ